ncbi:MAG: glycosyltransferase family 4 protein, partial [Acidobacteriota bacterium]
PSAVDLERRLEAGRVAGLRAELDIPAGARVGLTVGTLVEQKDPMTLVRALPHLPEDYVHVWIGPGELQREASLLADYLDVAERLRLFGFDPDPDRWFAIADVFVLPSVHEGLGSVLLDALHFGVPVVVSDIPATADLIEDEISGLRVPPRRPRELADAVARAMEDPALVERLVREGHRRVRDHDIRRTADLYLELYRELG